MKKARSDYKQRDLREKIKRDMYPVVRKEVEESYMQEKTLMLRDSQETQGDVGMDDATYCMATPHKSSCASTDPSDNDVAAGHDGAISYLYGQGERVWSMLTHYEGTLKCATTWV